MDAAVPSGQMMRIGWSARVYPETLGCHPAVLVVFRALPLFDPSSAQSGQRVGPRGRFRGRRPLLEETLRYELLEDHARSGPVVFESGQSGEDVVCGDGVGRARHEAAPEGFEHLNDRRIELRLHRVPRGHVRPDHRGNATPRVRVYGSWAMPDPGSITCPICGEGTLVTIDFGEQQPASREVQTFTCGHEVKGARLQTADADRLDVERRASDETAAPTEPEE